MKRLVILLGLSACCAFAQTPTITEILNNYGLIPSTSPNYGIAQGSIFIVKGSNLSDQTTGLQSVPLQTTLQGVRMRITVGGVTSYAPLYYVLPQQLAGILPSNTPVGTGTLVVENNGRNSSPKSLSVVRSAFGALTLNGAGTGAAAVHDQNYALLSSSNSTNPGKNIVFYGSGLGPTSGNETVEQTGANASGDLSGIPISITIGGKTAAILYRGRTQFPGLDQINVTVPTLDSGAYGCNVVVIITTNNVAANPTTIPVAESGGTCPPPSSGGGGNTGVEISQAERDAWIAAGRQRNGSVGLGRATAYSVSDFPTPGSVTILKNDTFSASFSRVTGPDLGPLLRGELPASYAAYVPVQGGCIVYTGIIPNPYPNLLYTALDAGPSISSNGPNGLQIATKSNNQVGGITYHVDDLPNTYVSPGRYTFTGNGGPDVGPFTGTLDVAAELIVTNMESFKTITRNDGATVRWTGGDPDAPVQIQGYSFLLDANNMPQTFAGFICLASQSAGQFTVPGSVLNQLPASPVISAGGISFVSRGSFAVAQAGKGTRLTASGLDYFTADFSWSWAITPEFK